MTKTIKQLFDEGQRQFPMRGGGVSPELIIWGHHFQAKNDKARAGRAFQCVAWRTLDGTNPDGFHALDLLPQPLPDYQVKIGLVKAEREAAKYEARKTYAKYEALVKACEPVRKFLKRYEGYRNGKNIVIGRHENVSAPIITQNGKMITLTFADLRAISALIGGE